MPSMIESDWLSEYEANIPSWYSVKETVVADMILFDLIKKLDSEKLKTIFSQVLIFMD